jgi:hydroxyacylglutathione hydrolase
VGWFVPFGAPIVLVLPEPLADSVEMAASDLFRIGYDRLIGVLEGGLDAWVDDGGALDNYPVTTGRATRDEVAGGARPLLLDVRYPYEWRDEGSVPGAIELSVGDLASRLDTLPRNAPITVMCKSGSRAAIAASILDAAGFDVRLIGKGGAPDLVAADAVAPDLVAADAVAPDVADPDTVAPKR